MEPEQTPAGVQRRFQTEIDSWQRQLEHLELDASTSIVIGSGIMQALGLRRAGDLDLVVTTDDYRRLEAWPDFEPGQARSGPILVGDGLEIFQTWSAAGANRGFDYLRQRSAVIDAIRYVSLEFLLAVKEAREGEGADRPKDHEDIRLIREHIASNPEAGG